MSTLLLIGGGGHCRSCIDIIETTGLHQIAGIIEREDFEESSIMGYPILGHDKDLPKFLEKFSSALITVGQIKSAKTRVGLFEKLTDLGVDLPKILSPYAYISVHSNIENGTIVMHQALVNANASIGKNCIINTQALIEHDAIIESHCHVSTGAIINGAAHIEWGAFVGSNATIREGVRIGNNCIIGAGAVVLHDLPAGTLYRGVR